MNCDEVALGKNGNLYRLSLGRTFLLMQAQRVCDNKDAMLDKRLQLR